MSIAALESPMAKKKGRPATGRTDVSAKVDAEIIRKAKIIAQIEDITLAEYLSRILGPVVDRDHDKWIKTPQPKKKS